MKLAWRICSLVVSLALGGYFLWFCWQHLDLKTLVETLNKTSALTALLAASLCYTVIYPLTGLAWRQLLLRQGQNWSPTRLTVFIGITQLAKYAPGNIAQHICRAAYSFKHGMPVRPYATTVVQETLLAAAASVLIGTLLLAPAAWTSTIADYRPILLGALAISCAGILIFCIDVPANSTNSNGPVSKLLHMTGGLPGPSTTLKALTAYCCNYLTIGVGIWLLALALGLSNVSYGTATSAFAIAWILGFLAPGAPAGLGAREGVMLLVLKGHASDEQVLQLVMLSRAGTMLGDLLAFSISTALSNHIKNKQMLT